MTGNASSSIWARISSHLVVALVTGIGAWLALGKDVVRREEMVAYVDTNSGWARAKGEVLAAVRANADSIERNAAQIANLGLLIDRSVSDLTKVQTELLIDQRVLVTRLDAWVDKTQVKDGR